MSGWITVDENELMMMIRQFQKRKGERNLQFPTKVLLGNLPLDYWLILEDATHYSRLLGMRNWNKIAGQVCDIRHYVLFCFWFRIIHDHICVWKKCISCQNHLGCCQFDLNNLKMFATFWLFTVPINDYADLWN